MREDARVDPGGGRDCDPGRFEALFAGLAAVGRHADGSGWTRLAFTDADRQAREWFVAAADEVGLAVETDRNANQWAWWGPPPSAGAGAVVVGSHLDTVPAGGAYDGALGVVAGFCAVAELAAAGFRPARPVAVAAFADEEGGRFGVATMGSRLLAGTLTADEVAGRRDAAGVTLADAAAAFGADPGPDPDRLARLGSVVELHVEQGRALAPRGAPLAVASDIWPHLRLRFALTGRADHAGTARLADRHDPVVVLAAAVAAARAAAEQAGGVATVGRVQVHPNSTNSVAATAVGWLDARAPREEVLAELLMVWRATVAAAAAAEGVELTAAEESRTPPIAFDARLRQRLLGCLRGRGLPEVVLSTAAGHDAGALAAVLPTGMIFVRNPTGVSHSPAEAAATTDCRAGVRLLADVVAELAGR